MVCFGAFSISKDGEQYGTAGQVCDSPGLQSEEEQSQDRRKRAPMSYVRQIPETVYSQRQHSYGLCFPGCPVSDAPAGETFQLSGASDLPGLYGYVAQER